MKLVFFEIEKWQEDYLKKNLGGFQTNFFSKTISLESTKEAEDADIVSVFIESKINRDILERLPKVKMIATRSTGFDHIDMDVCREKGVTVCNVPNYGENTVAEHTFALILDLSRKIHDSIEQVKKEGFGVEGLRGFDLKGKTLGIVGLGNIGRHVARIAYGFEMNVLAFDVTEDAELAKKLNITYVSLEELLKRSDIITLHVPYSDHTHHLINNQNINLIKRGSYLINTARGGIVETSALMRALEEGILAGAGLDVLEEERFIKEEGQLLSRDFYEQCDLKTIIANHVLIEKRNVIITPHNAWNSKEAVARILDTTAENIQSFTNGKPINTVNN